MPKKSQGRLYSDPEFKDCHSLKQQAAIYIKITAPGIQLIGNYINFEVQSAFWLILIIVIMSRTINNPLSIGNLVSWVFGILFLFIGLVNLFWGNDPGYGAFIILLSFVFFPPVMALVKEWTGISLHWIIKLFIGLFIIWSALGVGELFDKIEMMLSNF